MMLRDMDDGMGRVEIGKDWMGLNNDVFSLIWCCCLP